MMKLDEQQIAGLETPCLVIDVAGARANIEAMQKAVGETGTKLRPHIKTHKMPLFARMQVEAGADGITCAKVSEAEVMADGGLSDIFIAYPMVGAHRVKRAIALQKRVKRLILAVDSMASALPLNEAAKEAGVTLEVRLEVDTGAKRTGVVQAGAVELAKQVAELSNLRLTGFYTFKSLVYKDLPTDDNDLAGAEEGELLAALATAFDAAGLHGLEVSGGSTPTGLAVAKTGKVHEVRPGTYIFKDQLLIREKVADYSDVCVRFYATVVSTPSEEYAVLDGGTKMFPTDQPLNAAPFYFDSYALIEGRDDLKLARMNEEHGIVTSTTGKTGLKVGDVLALVPIHVCTAVNMQNEVYLLEDGVLRRQKVDARGMLV